eukprot:Awhi_evm1s4878
MSNEEERSQKFEDQNNQIMSSSSTDDYEDSFPNPFSSAGDDQKIDAIDDNTNNNNHSKSFNEEVFVDKYKINSDSSEAKNNYNKFSDEKLECSPT